MEKATGRQATGGSSSEVPPTETRRERHRRELIVEVLGIARRQLADGGRGSVTWRGIARQVGMNPASLYTYFANLDEIFTALILESFRRLAATVADAADAAGGDPLDRLLDCSVAYRSWALTNKAEFNLIFTDQLGDFAAPDDGGTFDAEMDVVGPFVAALSDLLGLSYDPSDLGSGSQDDQYRFMSLYGTLHGLVSLEANNHFPVIDDPEHRLRACLTELLESSSLRSADPDLPAPAATSKSTSS